MEGIRYSKTPKIIEIEENTNNLLLYILGE